MNEKTDAMTEEPAPTLRQPDGRLLDRLGSRFTVGDGCWVWTGTLKPGGYGEFWLDGAHHLAHHVLYGLLVGPIPNGLELDHTCHNADLTCVGGFACLHRRCVNPGHLEPVTHAVNVKRGRRARVVDAAKRKTHCPQSHPYEGDNLYVDSKGQRYCVACRRDNQRKRDAAKRASR